MNLQGSMISLYSSQLVPPEQLKLSNIHGTL